MRFFRFLFCLSLLLLTSACASGNGKWQSVTPEDAAARPALDAPQGLNVTSLFAEKINNPELRFQRLEGAVQDLRDDLDGFMPMMGEMIVGQTELQEAPAALPAPQPALPLAGTVTGVRMADHPDKTRLVLDMTAPLETKARIENGGKLLLVPVPNMGWAASKSWEAISAQLVSGWRLEGNTLRVELMYPSRIKAMALLAPTPANKSHRLMIDLFSPELHK